MKFRPKKAIFNPIKFLKGTVFQGAIDECRDLMGKILKARKKYPEKYREVIKPLLKKKKNTLRRYFGDLRLNEKFEDVFDRVSSLNNGLKSDLGELINGIRPGASRAKQVAIAALAHPFITPKRIDIPQLYIFPNNETTLVILLMTFSNSHKKFGYYKFFYKLLKHLYQYLNWYADL